MSEGVDALITRLKQAGLPEPQAEYKFHPTRKWLFDLAWPEQKIAVEVEGGVYRQGRHTRGAGYEGDLRKYNEAQRLGWRVYRFSTGMVRKDEAITFLEKALERREDG